MDLELRELVISELDRVFKNTFRFTDKDIKLYIDKILDAEDESVILQLTDLFVKFEKCDTNGKYSSDRSSAARDVLNRCISIYITNKEKIKTNFSTALEFAQKHGIDPFKIATKDNIRGLSSAILEQIHNTLTQIEYTNPISGEKFRLFNHKDFKNLLENCSSILCQIKEKNVREIIALLNCFSYDTETKAFKARPEEMIKICGTLITYPSAKMQSNIEFLKKNFIPPMSQAELIVRISKSPSILMCDQAKILNFEKNIYKNLSELRAESPALFPEGEEFEKYAKDYAHKAAFNIDKISSISGLTKENIEKLSQTKNVLVKYLGAKNAFEIFTDFNILSIEPKILGALLAKLTQYDNENNTLLRKYFIEHTARALNMLQKGELNSENPPRKTGRTFTPRKVRADLPSLPSQAEGDFHLTNSDARTVNNLFENVKQTFEARKQRKIVDGVEQLSEEEQEEREYMQEVFDRIQNGFDDAQCNSAFDNLISRIELMIDAKEVKGFADKMFSTNQMKHINRVYLGACADSKQLCEKLSSILFEITDLQDKTEHVLSDSAENFMSICKRFSKTLRDFLPLIEKVEDISFTVNRYVNGECLKVFKAIGLSNERTPNKNGDYYYETEWFDKDHNGNTLLLGMTVAQTQLAYAQSMRDYLNTIVPDYDNPNYGMAIDNLACEEINLKYLLYCHRLRSTIMSKVMNLTQSLYDTMVECGQVKSNSERNPVSFNVLADVKKNVDSFLAGQSPTDKLFGNPFKSLLELQLSDSPNLALGCLQALQDSYNQVRAVNSKVDKVLSKKRIDDFGWEYECVGKMYHTDGGLIIFPPTETGNYAMFMSQPEVGQNVQKIEKLGVEVAKESRFKNAEVANFTYSQGLFTEEDEKNILPIKFNDGK